MAITETLEKRRLVVTLGQFEAPSAWHWECVRFLRNDDGSDAAPPQNVSIACSAADVSAHIGQAMLDQIGVLTAKDALVAAAQAERDAAIADKDATIAKRDEAIAAAMAVASADADWEASVRPKIAALLGG